MTFVVKGIYIEKITLIKKKKNIEHVEIKRVNLSKGKDTKLESKAMCHDGLVALI